MCSAYICTVQDNELKSKIFCCRKLTIHFVMALWFSTILLHIAGPCCLRMTDDYVDIHQYVSIRLLEFCWFEFIFHKLSQQTYHRIRFDCARMCSKCNARYSVGCFGFLQVRYLLIDLWCRWVVASHTVYDFDIPLLVRDRLIFLVPIHLKFWSSILPFKTGPPTLVLTHSLPSPDEK